MPLIIPSNSISAGGFAVDNSLRFNDGSSDYLNRTLSAGNKQTWTWSGWIKRSNLGAQQLIMHCYDGAAGNRGEFKFQSNDTIGFDTGGDGSLGRIDTSAVYRDVSAWYHIVFVMDTTNATATDRQRIYVNGVRTTTTVDAQVGVNFNGGLINSANAHEIGTEGGGGSFFDGYMSEVCFIDGSALAPTDFGEFDEDSGIWKPIDVSGLTFGTNGFYLDFEDSGALGADVSGNTNNFTVNNLTAIDQVSDSPTNNWCLINPLDNFFAGSTFTEGNTTVDMTTSGVETFNTSTFAVSSGLWYAECKLIDSSSKPMVGISHAIPIAIGNVLGNSGFGYAYMGEDGQVKAEGSNGAYGATYTTNDIIGVYLDLTANKLYFAKNGALQNSGTGVSITAAASTANGHYFFGAGKRHSDNNQVSWNFGNPSFTGTDKADANGYGSFEYDPSVGTFDGASKDFYALCTKNLAEYG